jgi:hypothetical protein
MMLARKAQGNSLHCVCLLAVCVCMSHPGFNYKIAPFFVWLFAGSARTTWCLCQLT